jgi:hypothetical protein
MCWFPYCALFTTLFFPPPAGDVAGLLRFFGITLVVAAVVVGAGAVMQVRGAELARGFYTRAITPYAAFVLALVVVTSFIMR